MKRVQNTAGGCSEGDRWSIHFISVKSSKEEKRTIKPWTEAADVSAGSSLKCRALVFSAAPDSLSVPCGQSIKTKDGSQYFWFSQFAPNYSRQCAISITAHCLTDTSPLASAPAHFCSKLMNVLKTRYRTKYTNHQETNWHQICCPTGDLNLCGFNCSTDFCFSVRHSRISSHSTHSWEWSRWWEV